MPFGAGTPRPSLVKHWPENMRTRQEPLEVMKRQRLRQRLLALVPCVLVVRRQSEDDTLKNAVEVVEEREYVEGENSPSEPNKGPLHRRPYPKWPTTELA